MFDPSGGYSLGAAAPYYAPQPTYLPPYQPAQPRPQPVAVKPPAPPKPKPPAAMTVSVPLPDQFDIHLDDPPVVVPAPKDLGIDLD
jgi:hypothetical protein